MTQHESTAPFRISPYIAVLAEGSDISKPGSHSGYDENLAVELYRLENRGGMANLAAAGLCDLAEWLGAMEIGESESGNTAGARSCANTAANARALANTLQ